MLVKIQNCPCSSKNDPWWPPNNDEHSLTLISGDLQTWPDPDKFQTWPDPWWPPNMTWPWWPPNITWPWWPPNMTWPWYLVTSKQDLTLIPSNFQTCTGRSSVHCSESDVGIKSVHKYSNNFEKNKQYSKWLNFWHHNIDWLLNWQFLSHARE